MASDPISVRGIILNSREYKDKDRIVSVLTSDYGVIDVCVKGASSPKSNNAYASIPFILCEMVITSSHGFYYLKEGTIIENNSGIMSSLEAMAVAGHISQIICESVLQSDISSEAYKLCVYSLYALSENPDRYAIIYSVFNWRILYILGFGADYNNCSLCDSDLTSSSYVYLSLRDGQALCDKCVSDKGGFYRLSLKGVKLLNYIQEAPLGKIFTVNADNALTEEVRRFTTSYMSFQFDHEIPDPIRKLGLKG